MQDPDAGVVLQAKAMLGYGRVFERQGHGIVPDARWVRTITAIYYYHQPNLLFGPAAPAQSAEELFSAGQVYEKAGDKADAKKQYDAVTENYRRNRRGLGREGAGRRREARTVTKLARKNFL